MQDVVSLLKSSAQCQSFRVKLSVGYSELVPQWDGVGKKNPFHVLQEF